MKYTILKYFWRKKYFIYLTIFAIYYNNTGLFKTFCIGIWGILQHKAKNLW